MTVRPGKSFRRTALYTVYVLLLLVYLVPYLWLVLSSFKTRVDAFAIPPHVFFSPTLENYRTVFLEKGFLGNLLNSGIIAASSTTIALLAGVPAAYGLTRFRVRGSGAFLVFLLACRLLPGMVLVVPLFILSSDLRLVDTYFAVVIAHLTFVMPFVVWMMRGFFANVPTSIDEAAMIDGCGPLGAFIRVVLPLALGGLSATAIFCLIMSWNDFLFALILTGRDTSTLTAAVPNLLTPMGTFWGQIAAVGTVTTIPVLVFAIAVQKHIVSGMTGGAVQGE